LGASYTIGDGRDVQVPDTATEFVDGENLKVTISNVRDEEITLKITNPPGTSASTKVKLP
jgi:hypothetical protein